MTILDKHPAPWGKNMIGQVRDANGDVVLDEIVDANHDPDALPLILAAPELLAALKELLRRHEFDRHTWAPGTTTNEGALAAALIARIEGGNG